MPNTPERIEVTKATARMKAATPALMPRPRRYLSDFR